MERWKILHSAKNLKLKERTRNESCGRFGKRTPFLRGRVQLQKYKTELTKQKEKELTLRALFLL